MSRLQSILEFNQDFVSNEAYEEYITDKFSTKKMVIVTCMDSRLVELLPKALNLKNGDAQIIKTAGAVVSHPFGSVMRSIMLAIYSLKASEVLVIGHHDCGMTGLNSDSILDKAKERGISDEVFNTLTNAGIKLSRWLTGFDDVQQAVEGSVDLIRRHPVLPADVYVHGLIMDPKTGKLDLVIDGTKHVKQAATSE